MDLHFRLRRILNVVLPTAFALCAAGFQSQCAGAQNAHTFCTENRSAIFIYNNHDDLVRVTITDSQSHEIVYNNSVISSVRSPLPAETIVPAMIIQAGRSYNVEARDTDGSARTISPASFTADCTTLQSLVIASNTAPTLPRDAVRPTVAGGLSWPMEANECIIRPADPASDLFIYESIGATALGAQILANKAYLEDYFAAYFPDALAAAENGEAIHMELVTEPHTISNADGIYTEVVTDVRFTVDPHFLGLNHGMSAAGQFSVYKQIYMEYGTPVRLASFHANPVERRGETAFTANEYHMPHATLDNLEYDDVEFIQYDSEVHAGLEYQLGFVKSRCHDANAHLMTAFFRSRLVVDGLGLLSFSEWKKASPELQNCLMKELNKTLRGRLDFIRRKMMDLSGTDEMTFRWVSESSIFDVGYDGTYDCSRDILAGLIADVP